MRYRLKWAAIGIGAFLLVVAIALGVVFLLVSGSPEAGCYNAGGFVRSVEDSDRKLCDFPPRAENIDDLIDPDYWIE